MASNRLNFDGGYIDLEKGERWYSDGSGGKLDQGTLDMARSGLFGNQQVNLLGGGNSANYQKPAPLYEPPGSSGGMANTFSTKPQPMGGGMDTFSTRPTPVGDGTVVGGTPIVGSAPMATSSAPRASSTTGGVTGMPMGLNPYMQQQMDALSGQVNTNLNRNILPNIASSAAATGGYGSSRRGVVESNAISDANQAIASGTAGLLGQNFSQALNYDLGRRGQAQNYDLGLRGNDLGFAGLDAQINQNNFNNNLAGANFGLGVWNQGMQNNQTGITAGTNIQNTPQNYWSQFANQYNGIGQGYGSTTGSSSQQGNPVMGALGGAQLGSRVGQMWGGSPNAAGGANSSGWGSGSGYGNQDLGSFL